MSGLLGVDENSLLSGCQQTREKCGSTGSIGAGNLYVPAGNLFDLIHLLIKLKFDGVKKSVVLFFPEEPPHFPAF
jgi:hypothetical protein